MSLCVPITCATFAVWTKYALIVKRIPASDFTFGYFFIAKGIMFMISLVHFNNSQQIEWNFWGLGFVGSILDLIGCCFAN